jgi:hypothetical protein
MEVKVKESVLLKGHNEESRNATLANVDRSRENIQIVGGEVSS